MRDIIIIGSGPAGLSAAVYARRAQLDAVVVEKEFLGTGQIAVTEQVDNYLGLPGISGYDLGERFREHAESLGAEFLEGEISEIVPGEGFYTVKLKDGGAAEGRAVIYAAGASYRRLDVPGDKLLGVSYCAVCDGAFYKDKTVAVVGGGDTALGDAAYLSKIAKKVYIVHRRDEFRANRSLVEKVKSTANIELVTNAVVGEVLGDKKVSGIAITQNGEGKTLGTDGVFVAIGSLPNTALLKGICELDGAGYVIAGEDGITSAPGIFAAGDVRTKKLRQVITAAADGANCLMSAESYLNSL